jgi:DNA repair protein RecN (Recombination protein N)
LLKKLTIKNYALVETIEINFGLGLTVLTGETGAGKSVIIGGLALTLGGRADRDHIRHGTPKASVETTFEIDTSPRLKKKLKQELESPCDSQICLGREISKAGASKCFLNGSPIVLGKIRDAAPLLVDLHSQQGHRRLIEPDQHLRFLDSFAGVTKAAEKLAEHYHYFITLEKQLHEAKSNAAAMQEKLELINFQINELAGAGLRVGEESELEEERKRLESVRTLMETGQTAMAAISENDDAIISVLTQLEKQLQSASKIDQQLEPEASLLSESVINLNELTRNLESYLSRLEDNPDRLEEINARLAELYRLRKKYGTDEAGLPDKLEELKKQSLGAEDFDSLIKNISEKLTDTKKAYLDLALEVSDKRKAEAVRLEKKVEKQLTDLAISKSRFKIDFQTECDENGFEVYGEMIAAYPHGLENIEFLISTNPNEPLKPLAKIASGGELSRIMLALLTVIAGKYQLPTIIFDEIDTGIGGVTANRLAEKLKELSKKHQVITISHLSAIAIVADHHLAVSKSLKNGRNIISVNEVKGGKLKKELARMAGKIS